MSLVAFLDGRRIGALARVAGRLRFVYDEAVLTTDVGRPLLSVSMPVRRQAYRGDVVEAWFDGLLPEGDAFRMLAYDFGIQDSDSYGMLERLGRDCAGAIQILRAGSEPSANGGSIEALSDIDLDARMRALRHAPLGIDERVRISLAGVQEKLVLARDGERWALPLDGAPSTHILKPAHPLLPNSVENEAFCLAVARASGIDVADAQVARVGERAVLIVARYDRTPGSRPRRVHQEDMCQSQGISPRRKYEEQGGPSLASCALTLRRWGSDDTDVDRLLEIATLNVALGNADAHGKNLSLLHQADGSIRLAPAYDLLCTRYYGGVDRTAGMFVNGIRDIDAISRGDLVAEGASWGVRVDRAARIVDDLLDRMQLEVERVAADLAIPEEFVDLVDARVRRLRG